MSLRKIDWIIALTLAILFSGWVYLPLGLRVAGSAAMRESDLIFGADAPRVVEDLASFRGDPKVGSNGRNVGHWRTAPHPLFVILLNPVGVTLAKIVGQQKSAAILLAAAGGLAAALAYFVILTIGLRRDSAALLAIILGSSGSHVIFATVPETYIFSAAVLMFLVLCMVRWPNRIWPSVVGGVFALGILITNIVQAGILYWAQSRAGAHTGKAGIGGQDATNSNDNSNRGPFENAALNAGGGTGSTFRRLAVWFIAVMAITVALNIAQRLIYPGAGLFFLPSGVTNESRFVDRPHSLGGWVERTECLFHAMVFIDFVSPEPEIVSPAVPPRPGSIGFTAHAPHNTWAPAGVGVALVFTLWIGAIWSLFRWRLWRDYLVLGLLLCLAFNFVLHMAYGRTSELYLYSCDWTGLVIIFWARCWLPWLINPGRIVLFNVGLGVLAIVCLENSLHFMEKCLAIWG